MQNKTCGECKHFYTSDEGHCSLKGDWGFCDDDACKDFCLPIDRLPAGVITAQKPTNGDKIRQMNNTNLAEMLVYPVKPLNINGDIHYEFTSCLLLGKSYPMREQAVFLTEKRLNAPAESEGKDE
jgi:hypothetical protein